MNVDADDEDDLFDVFSLAGGDGDDGWLLGDCGRFSLSSSSCSVFLSSAGSRQNQSSGIRCDFASQSPLATCLRNSINS